MENVDKYDQHLMTDKSFLDKIITLSHIKKTDIILEIGAGSGNLTKLLADNAKKVYAIEIDLKFKPILDKLQKKHPNLEVNYENALKVVFRESNKIISNIPYNVAEPLLNKLIRYNFDLAVLTVSKSFADALVAESRDYAFSRLSIITPAFYNVKLEEEVPKEAFSPRPRTKSMIITLVPINKEDLLNNSKLYILRELYEQKTKKTKNALRESLIRYKQAKFNKQLTKKEVKSIIDNMKLPSTILNKDVTVLSKEELELVLDAADKIYIY